MSERHFFRCGNCCLVYAFEGDSRKIGYNGRGYSVPPTPPACDCGAGSDRQHWMGKVAGDSLLRESERCPCDSRCTDAAGPKCSCQCGGANHGTHRVVKVTEREGVPVLASDNLPKRLAAVAEVAAAKGAAMARIRDRWPAAHAAMTRGEWVADRAAWEGVHYSHAAVRKAMNLASLAGRLRALSKIAAVAPAPQPAGDCVKSA